MDHIGEALHVLKQFQVAHIIMNSYSNTEIEDTIEQRYNNVIKVNNKMMVKIGEHRLEIVSIPNKEENQNSLILILRVYNKKILLTSDITKEEEKILLNTYNLEKVDILKVAHHGSNTSSSQIFINTIRPKYSILQVGEKNRFGHPHIEVLEHLSHVHSTILDTRATGSIQFVWNKYHFKWIVCNS